MPFQATGGHNMASVHKQPGKPFWYCAYTTKTPDGTFKRHFKSTKTANRKQAEEICRSWEQAARQASNGRLTPEDIHRQYAHLDVEDLRRAMEGKLPDVTKTAK
jgi:hypothetical protein